ncbi:MAG: haloalkane dehalogenase, partial [Bradyrhizobium sp. DFCI-1]
MSLHEIAGAVCRSLAVRKDGPSLYDVCDPVLQAYRGGDPHLGKFYRTALGNPPLRALLRRTGLPALQDPDRLAGLRAALTQARDAVA